MLLASERSRPHESTPAPSVTELAGTDLGPAGRAACHFGATGERVGPRAHDPASMDPQVHRMSPIRGRVEVTRPCRRTFISTQGPEGQHQRS